MNILVIGNGFDIAHGLPTSYQEFLRFASEIDDVCVRLQKNGIGIKESTVIANEIEALVNDNYWINYFMRTSNCGENWIDFETEISKVIQRLDEIRKIAIKVQTERHPGAKEQHFSQIENQYPDISAQFDLKKDQNILEWIQLIKRKALFDLNRLTRCLEIYLSQYVNRIDIKGREIEMIKNLQIDAVLSFNYTNTFEKLYGNGKIKYHYIHGKADCSHTVDECNMVLGIDEYLKGDEKNSDNEFIEFNKFFQRIYKGTGAEYKVWIRQMEEPVIGTTRIRYQFSDIYIFGHSLDVTDKDVLQELLLCPYARTHIVYHNKKALADKIANLVKVIGQDRLIEKTYAEKTQIDFVANV